MKFDKIGIEFECGFDNVRTLVIRNELSEYATNVRFDGDGSVHVGCPEDVIVEGGWLKSAEITMLTTPRNVYKCIEILHRHCYQNFSCGNHLHLSFDRTGDFVSMMSYKEIFNGFIEEYKNKWGKFPKYMARETNDYCKFLMTEEIMSHQLSADYKGTRERYRAINLNPYNEIGTMEIRALPYMDDAVEHNEAIRWVLRTLVKLFSTELTRRKVIRVRKFDETPKKLNHQSDVFDVKVKTIKENGGEICVLRQ